jgi:lipopolysaccharide/colanic/teichoic acid biosynthesis glycosyltransferase
MYHGVKRILDVVLSGLALLVLAPLLIPVGIGLLLTGEHYVFLFAFATTGWSQKDRKKESQDV